MAAVIKTLSLSDGVAVAAPTVFNGTVSINADLTLTDSDGISFIDVSPTALRTITFPTPSASNSGRQWVITKVGSGSLGVALAGTISGLTTNNTIFAQYGTATVRSDGAQLIFARPIYEQGAWTPATNFATTQAGGADSGAAGWYVRNGRNIQYGGYVGLNDTGNVAAGAFRVSGLPFVSRSGNIGYAASSSRIEDSTSIPAQVYDQYSYIAPNSTMIQFVFIRGNNTTALAISGADLSATSADIIIGGSYVIA